MPENAETTKACFINTPLQNNNFPQLKTYLVSILEFIITPISKCFLTFKGLYLIVGFDFGLHWKIGNYLYTKFSTLGNLFELLLKWFVSKLGVPATRTNNKGKAFPVWSSFGLLWWTKYAQLVFDWYFSLGIIWGKCSLWKHVSRSMLLMIRFVNL